MRIPRPEADLDRAKGQGLSSGRVAGPACGWARWFSRDAARLCLSG